MKPRSGGESGGESEGESEEEKTETGDIKFEDLISYQQTFINRVFTLLLETPIPKEFTKSKTYTPIKKYLDFLYYGFYSKEDRFKGAYKNKILKEQSIHDEMKDWTRTYKITLPLKEQEIEIIANLLKQSFKKIRSNNKNGLPAVLKDPENFASFAKSWLSYVGGDGNSQLKYQLRKSILITALSHMDSRIGEDEQQESIEMPQLHPVKDEVSSLNDWITDLPSYISNSTQGDIDVYLNKIKGKLEMLTFGEHLSNEESIKELLSRKKEEITRLAITDSLKISIQAKLDEMIGLI